MESTQKGKDLLPLGANSFLLEKTPFEKGLDVQKRGQENGYTFNEEKKTTLLIILASSEKGSTLKGKNLLSFFKFEFGPFWKGIYYLLLEGALYAEKQTGNHRSCLPCEKWVSVPNPLKE